MLTPKQQQRPLPSLLYVSFFYGLTAQMVGQRNFYKLETGSGILDPSQVQKFAAKNKEIPFLLKSFNKIFNKT